MQARADTRFAQQLTWMRRLQMAIDGATGMLHLHSHRPPIIHRDLKSPNLFVDKGMHVKVGGRGCMCWPAGWQVWLAGGAGHAVCVCMPGKVAGHRWLVGVTRSRDRSTWLACRPGPGHLVASVPRVVVPSRCDFYHTCAPAPQLVNSALAPPYSPPPPAPNDTLIPNHI